MGTPKFTQCSCIYHLIPKQEFRMLIYVYSLLNRFQTKKTLASTMYKILEFLDQSLNQGVLNNSLLFDTCNKPKKVGLFITISYMR